MKLRLLAIATLVCASAHVSAQAPAASASAQTLNIKFDITNNGESIGAPRLIAMAGETFSIEIGSKYRHDPSSPDKSGHVSVNKGSIGTQIKCKPELQAGETATLDCNFRTTDVAGENTRTKSWQAKILVTNGKPTAMWFGDKGQNGEVGGPQGLNVSIVADWTKAS